MSEDNVPFSKWADKNESRKKIITERVRHGLLANVTHAERAQPSQRTLNTTIPLPASKSLRAIA